jgi:hypothetical protein
VAEEAARVSHALQPAYFRDLLTDKRAQLDADVAGMRRQLEISTKTGNRFGTNRLHFLVRQHQNELSHLDLTGRRRADLYRRSDLTHNLHLSATCSPGGGPTAV